MLQPVFTSISVLISSLFSAHVVKFIFHPKDVFSAQSLILITWECSRGVNPPLSGTPSVLMLGLFLYSCWRRHKGLKEGVYHVSAHHGEWEDIRENVLNYDEEGGGEQDQVSAHARAGILDGGGEGKSTERQTQIIARL